MRIRRIIQICIIQTIIFSGLTGQDNNFISLQGVDFVNGTANVHLTIEIEISGIHLNFSGIQINGVYGGLIDELNLDVSYLDVDPNVDSFETGILLVGIINPGEHMLFELEFDTFGNSICIYNAIANVNGESQVLDLINSCEFEFGNDWDDWVVCTELNSIECGDSEYCVLNDAGDCVNSWGDWGDWVPCHQLNNEECEEAEFCQLNYFGDCTQNWDNWNDWNDWISCDEMSMEECDETNYCLWDSFENTCDNSYFYNEWMDQFCNGLSENFCQQMPACTWENGECFADQLNEDDNFYSNVLNGHLDDYLTFQESTNLAIISYVTIEIADDLDFGDDIGVFDMEGGYNYGDCSDQFQAILVGSDEWNGTPLTIPAYGHIDHCEDDGFQLPGFLIGNAIEIHVWDESEGVEYILELNRDEFIFNEGFITIGNVQLGNVLNINDEPVNKKEFELIQNFPNPFNPETIISFQLEKMGEVKLDIYDLNGQLIEEVFSENLPIGKHEISWSGADIPSGIYFCRVTSQQLSAAKKILLLK